jgi:hypothetical protein
VYSFTTIYEAPAGFDDSAPYTVALVRLEEGPLLTSQLTDLGEQPPEIGLPVEMVTRRLRSDGDERGMLIYGYKFRLTYRCTLSTIPRKEHRSVLLAWRTALTTRRTNFRL